MATYREYIKQDGKKTVTARVRVAGIEDTKTFSGKTDAKEWAKRREVELKEKPHLAHSEAHKHALAAGIDRYLETVVPGKAAGSQIKDKQRLSWWRENYGHYTFATFQAPVIVEARDALLKSPALRYGAKSAATKTPATVNRYLAVMGHLLVTAQREWHWIQINPMDQVSKLKERNERTRYLEDTGTADSPSELGRLLDACRLSESQDLYLAVLVGLMTGGRRNEVLLLTWRDIDLGHGTVTLSGQKTGTRRTVTIPAEVVDLLAERRGPPKALVFSSANDPARPTDLRSAWETALRRAEIENFRWHDLRHSAASYLAMEGASLADIAGVLGHRTLQMVKRYSHLSPEHIAKASAKIGERVLGGGK